MDRVSLLQKASSFTVFYGFGREEELRAFDIAVIEPAGHQPDQIALLRNSGTLVIAYVSFMEVRPEDPYVPLLEERDWLRIGNRPVYNEAYGNRLADLRSGRWAGLLHERLGRLLLQEGYDGVFIDTIGDVEWPSIPSSVKQEQIKAAVDLIKGVKSAFPGHLLIQNNGITELILRTAPWIDAICWENPLFMEPHLSWSRNVANRLIGLNGKKGPLRTLLLYEAGAGAQRSMPVAMRYARAHGWLVSQSAQHYL